MIVDTPGLGESQDLDDIVYQYLPQVFAFIFVLTAANSDGINNNTVSTLKAYVHKLLAEFRDWVNWLKWSHKILCGPRDGLVSSPQAGLLCYLWQASTSLVNQPILYQFQ